MKIVLRIIIILLVASAVAGVFSLAVNNSSTSASGGQPLAMTSNNAQSTTQSITRPEGGDREGGSITRGLPEVLGTLGKLTGITLIVLLLQKAFSLLGNRRFIPTQQ